MNYDARTQDPALSKKLENIRNRIWITERCHMNAEKRSRFLELYFHIVLALFALASIGISILNGTDVDGLKESFFSFASITTLCISLLIFGFKFGETAANHRTCYLSLQALQSRNVADNSELEQEYIKILGHHPNHTSGDYMRLALSNIWTSRQKLESPLGEQIELSLWTRIVYIGGWLLARLFLLAFAIMPFFLAAYGIDFERLFASTQ